ncbi:putative protein kinase RLK-Pelle-CrRLK1L-1 family [Helianthus annuus]|uniref:Protein kinase domain-containing protein n=1 Tax=Helianthus annuus TaxID=4232 RepID=A0A251T058_HELAN|nr:probable receptor-like protein kinase At2g39360 [Helianthus annuus]KAF5777155.1 putative protein kinase RLK-Pelle-CrRLK1L-1 family [Helianthus annuus]KAJ0488747.1 putative protein kinase RLK-Pelle-CrRLK1L-1 family [Helianthus annuus]KAJ0492312.1 putative protein kinase RLK-Pelle-CrRLK1L-1 family [Helianthus annuus]KAJ0504584.1 putative protein kinase RLK-Pelle-CrRLK1L-1 family [Helianthus annuus]
MSSIEELKHLQIPLQDISLATNGFSDQNIIAKGGFGKVYEGVSEKHGHIAVKRLEHRQGGQGDHEFKTEIALLSEYEHKNIVSLLGFCDEDGEKILVYKYESKGSLDKHLNNKDLTWIQRIQICLDAAHGLKYLHDDGGPHHGIIHRDVKSSNILLDENSNAKISDFGLSRVGPANTQSSFLISNACGTPGYIDPDYLITGYLTEKSDVYSFGVVLLEVLCGRHALVKSYKDERQFLTVLIQKHYTKGTLDKIIPSYLHEQINPDSLHTFANIAYQCLKNRTERPTMQQVIEQLEKALHSQLTPIMSHSINEVKHLQIPLQDIILACNKFSYQNYIRRDGSAWVYEGISEKHGPIYIMRLDPGHGLGYYEFKKEISLLSEFKCKNVITLVGFCNEDGEKILIFKYERNGSLDQHVNNRFLSWSQRIQICRDAASAMLYLQDDARRQGRILYHDIKSSHILLDEAWRPKITNIGLSGIYPSIKDIFGLTGYSPEDYLSSQQKSDIYSFGVILLEVLCGRRAHVTSDKDNPQSLAILYREHYEKQTLDSIIPSYLRKQINTDSLVTFSNIAYQCLKNVDERPTMKQVMEQLQKALDQQLLSCSN